MTWTRSYNELAQLTTFEDRLDYLRLNGGVGRATFGFDRYLNQRFYTSAEWKNARRFVILRDEGCDLGIADYPIHTELLIHHMNPVTADDILSHAAWMFDPEYLITTTQQTHNAIHYGAKSPYPKVVLERTPGDTKPW